MESSCRCGARPSLGDRFCRQCGRELADTAGFVAGAGNDTPTVKVMPPPDPTVPDEPPQGNRASLPDDLELAYDAANGSLPPPYALASSLRFWADGRALALCWLGYGADHWQDSFAVEPAALASVYAMVRDLPALEPAGQPQALGSSTSTLTITAGGASSKVALAPDVSQRLRALVPAAVWARLGERQRAFQARAAAEAEAALARELAALTPPARSPSDTQPVSFVELPPSPEPPANAERPRSRWNPLAWLRRR